MEILVGASLKTLSTYLDHISPAVIDDAFGPEQSVAARYYPPARISQEDLWQQQQSQ